MKTVRALLARIAGLFGGSRADAELREELESHLAMETEENLRRGLMPEEARRRALIASGGLTQAAEAVRERRGLPWIETTLADVRYAVRTLRRSPVFTTVVVVTLALGIGANTAIFSVIRGVLLKPLPNRDGARLVYLRHSQDGAGGQNILFSVPEVHDYRTGAPAFGGIAEYCPWTSLLQGTDAALHIPVALVTGNFFDVMGLAPVLGRLTRPSDDGPGVPPVVVLTREFWMQRFGGDPGIVGRSVRLDGKDVTVIGVLQSAPLFPDQVDAFANMVLSPHHLSALMVQGRTHRMTEMIARLAPGATLAEARAQATAVDARAQHDWPAMYDPASHYRVAVIPYVAAMGENVQLALWLLMGAAAFVMIITAANVVNLTLMRGVRREPELVTRAALGSGAARLRRLLLAENLVLTLAGAGLGLLLALGGVRLLAAFAGRYTVRAAGIHVDGVVLAFTLALSAAVALLLSFAGAVPREGRLASLLAAGGRRAGGSARALRLQRGLVVAQVAASVVLLAGAGLLTRTLIQISAVPTGLVTDQVVTMDVQLLDYSSGDVARMAAADPAAKAGYDQMEREMQALPGVMDAGVGSVRPLSNSGITLELKVEGRAPEPGRPVPMATLETADPDYFRASGIPLLEGRTFQATDRMGAGKVVVVNSALARLLFAGDDPIGKRVAWTGDVLRFTPFTGDWRTIVGVVGDTRDQGPDAPPTPVMYEPFAQELALGGALVIRAATDVAGLVPTATQLVHRDEPGVPVDSVLTVAQVHDRGVAPQRLNAELLSLFGVLAVVIAAVGIAGVLGFSVTARTVEIGIRMSLGADGGAVQRMILGEGGVLLGMGLAIGLAGAWLATGLFRVLLFGVAPHDPATLLGVALAMAAIGLAACWIPALRASRIDPAVTMRGQ